MPDDILGGQGTTLLMAIVIVAVALLALVAVFWLIKNRSSSTFIRGGRARQPRLAVLDAAAVDTRRRIVLIRRDDVEHLVMIGGPTDVVIESRIVHSDETEDNTAHSTQQAPENAAPPSDHLPPDLMATAKSIARSAQKSAQRQQPEPAPVKPQEQPVAAPLAVGAAATAAAANASEPGSVESEAADILESARARVFDEPDFDSDAATVAQTGGPAHAPASPRQTAAAPTAYEEVLADQDNSTPFPPGSGETVEPDPQSAAPVEPVPDFESVLAAELSEDLSLDPFEDLLVDEISSSPANVETAEAPEVQSDTKPSRDSLEAEMERLLGGMARKP